MVDKKKIDRNRQLITVLSLIALVLVFGQVAVFIYFGGQGAKAAQVNQTKNDLIRENKQLETEILHQTSFSFILERAQELGFKQASSIVYLEDQLPIAFKSK
ncbi:hypothetical protein COT63_01330 [Candidatus Shapirobacteria bacterium CG09_land_8_20_14_0_10_38_17]|uniref:Cell division protein FtsL n=1 Tax=Candidatus Shapirobacteria bacterium CG09_land_8_20_14_0_10_38_17 TaxID=1974884 RepID=A0A2H0WRB1_9BACT|nr:MAG: hypothetical protein COT63_01330 [Candidatus Shapirobacteria bacterium CG09_land_8_20_14_0_10_38_17]